MNITSSHDSPVFIVAPVRSGSTMFHLMMGAHPDISSPGECDFLFDQVGDNGTFPAVDDYQTWLRLNRIYQAKNLTLNEDLPYKKLMASFGEQLQAGKPLLSINVHRNFTRIPTIYPNARYIHLLRDARDVARSTIGMGWAGNVYHGVDIWTRAELSWDNLKKTLRKDQYIEIKYEELLADVETVLTQVCDFIGVTYSTTMLNYSAASTYSKPNPALCYQWRKKYTNREKQLVEGKVGQMLQARGYELSGLSPVVPTALSKLLLKVSNKMYRVRFQIRRYGCCLYFKKTLANKLGINSWRESCQLQTNNIDITLLK